MTEEKPIARSSIDDYLAKERKLRVIAWVSIILPLAVFLTLIYMSGRQAEKFQRLRGKTGELQKQISETQSKLEQMKRDINFYASQVAPSVDIFFANDGQHPKANEVAEQLKRLGYEATAEDKPLRVISQNTYIRYFFKEDKTLAEKIQGQIKAMGVNAQIQSFAEETDREELGYVRPKALELWLGKRFVPTD